MFGTKLKIAFWNYDRGKLLRDGTVKIDGVDAEFPSGRIVTDIFAFCERELPNWNSACTSNWPRLSGWNG